MGFLQQLNMVGMILPQDYEDLLLMEEMRLTSWYGKYPIIYSGFIFQVVQDFSINSMKAIFLVHAFNLMWKITKSGTCRSNKNRTPAKDTRSLPLLVDSWNAWFLRGKHRSYKAWCLRLCQERGPIFRCSQVFLMEKTTSRFLWK